MDKKTKDKYIKIIDDKISQLENDIEEQEDVTSNQEKLEILIKDVKEYKDILKRDEKSALVELKSSITKKIIMIEYNEIEDGTKEKVKARKEIEKLSKVNNDTKKWCDNLLNN